MAHWFHRNPLKATGPQDFNLKMVSHDVEAIKVRLKQMPLCSYLSLMQGTPHIDYRIRVAYGKVWKQSWFPLGQIFL